MTTEGQSWQAPDMSGHDAHLREVNRLVFGFAFPEAKRLKLGAVGPEVIVLGILHPDAGPSIAADVLRECGLDRANLERRLLSHYCSDREKNDGPQLNPAAYKFLGMAEGIAAGLGAETVNAEHVLLAFIWDPSFYHEQLEPRGASRKQLREALAHCGVALSQRELPAADPRRYGPPVYLSGAQLRIALAELRHVLPDGASWAFNYDHEPDRAHICISEGLDPEHYVRLALQRQKDSPQ